MLEKKRKDEMLMNLTRILAFGQPENKGLTSVPIGISPIDREFTESKKPTTTKERIRDLETVLKEFA